METPKAHFWNVWWTLTMISAALTLVALALEAFGILDDVGLAASLAGLLLSMIFGLSASTRSSLGEFRGEALPRLDQMAERLDAMTERLDRIVTILDERLPRPTV